MAWIELHQSVWTNKKTVWMASLLNIKSTYAAAHMAKFWTWALDNAPDGEISGIPNQVIAIASDWDEDPDLFVESLITVGWLVRSDNQLFIHDWHDYAGRLMEQRKHKNQVKARNKSLYDDRELTTAIKERDGDNCRYCGREVDWKDRKSSKGSTYDHVDPEGPNSVANVVVSCRGCNSAKGRRTPQEARMPLLPPGTKLKSTGNLLERVDNLTENLPYRTIPNHTEPKDNNTAAAAREESQQTVIETYRKVKNRDLTPFQLDKLMAYVDNEGFDPAVVVHAIERAGTADSSGIKLILTILNDYAACGAKSIDRAAAFDAEFDAHKARGQPRGQPNRHQKQMEDLDRFIEEEKIREQIRSG